MSAPASLSVRVLNQGKYEAETMLRNGEQLILAVVLPLLGLIALGVLLILRFPKRHSSKWFYAVATVLMVCSVFGMVYLPEAVFVNDKTVQYAGSDYGRAQSAKAAYTNMFNAHRLYRICGVYQTGVKDIILPGEIREIMNTVLVAEKRAQANVITRREEVASTRSLLNTAKLMDENQTLYKLKELEYVERICENVGNISLNGNGNILGQLTAILNGNNV